MSRQITLKAEIPYRHAGKRLDQVLAELFPDYSRARLQSWVRNGEVTLDGVLCKSKQKVRGGEQVAIDARLAEEQTNRPQAIDLDVLYDDNDLIVINKPPGLVVHPAAGHADSTLLNGLLHRYPELAQLPRVGIVHRLDKDTSGLMVIARSLEAHHRLVKAMQDRQIKRRYQALVYGEVIAGGRVEAPMGRHPVDRKKMAVREDGREAVTHYRVGRRFEGFTLLDVALETGRTHQIRVHLAHIGYPIVGDPVYARQRLPKACHPAVIAAVQAFHRQALHACELQLQHPVTENVMDWTAEMPTDLHDLISTLQEFMPKQS